MRHPAFLAGETDTGFIERHRADLLPAAAHVPLEALVAAAARVFLDERQRERRRAALALERHRRLAAQPAGAAAHGVPPPSPWERARSFAVDAVMHPGHATVTVDGRVAPRDAGPARRRAPADRPRRRDLLRPRRAPGRQALRRRARGPLRARARRPLPLRARRFPSRRAPHRPHARARGEADGEGRRLP